MESEKELIQAIQSMRFMGEVTPKILKFEGDDADSSPLFLSLIVSRDDKDTWQAYQDLLSHAVKMAQAQMSGIFGMNVLTLTLVKGLKYFDPANLSRLLVQHSRKLAPGQKAVIQYTKTFFQLHKRVPADWGKIDLKTHVEIVDPKTAAWERTLKKMIRDTGSPEKGIYGIQDLSAKPLFDPTHANAAGLSLPGIRVTYIISGGENES